MFLLKKTNCLLFKYKTFNTKVVYFTWTYHNKIIKTLAKILLTVEASRLCVLIVINERKYNENHLRLVFQ